MLKILVKNYLDLHEKITDSIYEYERVKEKTLFLSIAITIYQNAVRFL